MRGVGETKYIIAYSKKSETPIAEISAEMRGAWRSGLYASFSMTMPKSPVMTIARMSAGTMGSPRFVTAKKPRYAPTM